MESKKADPPLILNNIMVTNEKIGTGGTSEVFLGYDIERKQPVALKRASISKIKMWDWEREIMVLNSLRGEPNITTLLDVLFQPSTLVGTESYVYQVYELINGKDLLELFNSNPHTCTKNLVRLLFFQIVEIINRCHKRGVVHLDIKPENIMYDTTKNQLFLIDFGFAETFQHSNPETLTKKSGSVEYCAPEIYFDSKYDGQKADVWSLGVLLYVLLFHKFPYTPIKLDKEKMSHVEYLRAMFEDKLSGDLWFPETTSSSLSNLIQSMLNPNPRNRLSPEQILKHEWFSPLQNQQHVQLQLKLLHHSHSSQKHFLFQPLQKQNSPITPQSFHPHIQEHDAKPFLSSC